MAEKELLGALPGGREEAVPHVLYSTRRIGPAIASTDVLFFNYTVGQTIDAIVATPVDTNMKKANAIENPNRFWIKKIDLLILPFSPLSKIVADDNTVPPAARTLTENSLYMNDINNILMNAQFVLTVANKDKIVAAPVNDLLSTSQILPSGFCLNKKGFVLETPEALLPEINFSARLTIGAGAVALAGLTRIVMRFHGKLVRNAEM